MGNLSGGKPTWGGKDGKSVKDRGAGKFCKEVVRRRRVILLVPFYRDPVKKDLAVASDGDTPAIRTKGSK